jgi:leucyl/phenylalanyl-tRNA--protein transferase
MPVYKLHPEFMSFPPRSEFDDDMIAIGGDLKTERLIEAYSRGVFPWYSIPGRLCWYSPVERCVLPVDAVVVSHSMKGLLRREEFRFTMDEQFRNVIEACREGERVGQTWIHDEIVDGYCALHRRGLAHSLEVWKEDQLVGGLYGVSLGAMFFGESMFSRSANASKAALIRLCQFLPEMGIQLVDCQVPNDHLLSMGAEVWHRDDFLDVLELRLDNPTQAMPWQESFDRWNYKRMNNPTE